MHDIRMMRLRAHDEGNEPWWNGMVSQQIIYNFLERTADRTSNFRSASFLQGIAQNLEGGGKMERGDN